MPGTLDSKREAFLDSAKRFDQEMPFLRSLIAQGLIIERIMHSRRVAPLADTYL